MSDTETTTEDPRVTRARAATAVDVNAIDELVDTDPLKLRDLAFRQHAVIEGLLAYFDERHAALDAAWRKPFDDLQRTVAEIRAERGERP